MASAQPTCQAPQYLQGLFTSSKNIEGLNCKIKEIRIASLPPLPVHRTEATGGPPSSASPASPPAPPPTSFVAPPRTKSVIIFERDLYREFLTGDKQVEFLAGELILDAYVCQVSRERGEAGSMESSRERKDYNGSRIFMLAVIGAVPELVLAVAGVVRTRGLS
jgi:hypothetical protein